MSATIHSFAQAKAEKAEAKSKARNAKLQVIAGTAGRGALALGRGLARGLLLAVRAVAHLVLSSLRRPARFIARIGCTVSVICIPVVWFALPALQHRPLVLTALVAASAGFALLHWGYDWLLVTVRPKSPDVARTNDQEATAAG